MLVRQPPELIEVGGSDRLADAIADLAYLEQIVLDRARPGAHRFGLLAQNVGRGALHVGVIEVGVRGELVDRVFGQRDLLDAHRAVLGDVQLGQAAGGGHVLILLADRLLEHVEFDAARLVGEFLEGRRPAAVGADRAQQTDQIATRRAESGAGRQIGQRRDLDAVVDVVREQRLARQFVLEVLGVVDDLALRVVQAHLAVGVGHVERHVHVLIDARGKNVAAVLLVETRQVGAAASERDAEGRSRNDHRFVLVRRAHAGRLGKREVRCIGVHRLDL